MYGFVLFSNWVHHVYLDLGFFFGQEIEQVTEYMKTALSKSTVGPFFLFLTFTTFHYN